MLSENKDSEIVNTIKSFDSELQIGANLTDMATQTFGIKYSFNYCYDDLTGVKPTEQTYSGTVSFSTDMASAMATMMPGANGSQTVDTFDLRDRLVRALSGNDLANKIRIYPVSFDEKQHVTDYLDKWNSDEDIVINGEHISQASRQEITFMDNLDLVITMINTMINIVSYALIAFTSVSLVVSTVMIGIITYVSVVERIKEIGVIRSLGGRKKDVSHLFNAETFIIGLLAGVIGIGATYLISLIVNLILKPLIGYASIAALPVSQAFMLIVLSIVLTSISGLIPAKSAANKDPVVALRTE
jgi:putative ABC transport system permease protein